MSSKGINCSGVSRINSPLNSTYSGGNRKQILLNSPNRNTSGLCFELKGESAEYLQPVFCETNLSMSSLKIRLAPTIQSTLAAAVDTLLSEVALVLNDALTETHQELATREQENERLKLRLEVSEGELKALQECLNSAQKLIDQLPIPLSDSVNVGQSVFATSGSSANTIDRNYSQFFSNRSNVTEDGRCLPRCSPQLSGSLGDTSLQGFNSGDELKVGQLSIQVDGTVTNHLLNSFTASSASPWTDLNRTDGCAAEQRRRRLGVDPGPSSEVQETQPRFVIKQEQDLTQAQHGRPGPEESEQTAQSVGELGYIHVVEEEHPSRAHGGLLPPGEPPQRPPPRSHLGPAPAPKALSKPHPGMGVIQAPPRLPSSAGPAADAGERPHVCLECGKAFRLISSLKKHIRIHTGEKPYPCGVCGRRFRESGALKTHQRIHTGEKPYSCSDCGTSFRHLDGLRKHRRTHTGEKPYACGVCGKRLSRLQHLKHHQRIHTGERPCRCPRCSKSFKEPAALRKHLRTHREEPGGVEAAALDVSQPPMLSPPKGFAMWGDGGEEGTVMNCVDER